MSDQPSMEVDCASVKARLDDASDRFVFLDCREQEEFDNVRIDGATLLPMSAIQERIGELESNKDDDIIIHCHHGGRSMRVAMWMRQQGFTKAQSMAGGIDVWAQEIEPGMTRY